jgi:hypothetical protein
MGFHPPHVSHPLHQTEGVSHAVRGKGVCSGGHCGFIQLDAKAGKVRITGTVPALLTDFGIDPPSLLAIAVKNEIPVRLDMTWHQ